MRDELIDFHVFDSDDETDILNHLAARRRTFVPANGFSPISRQTWMGR
ncbi:MAG TPA: hypothetical protein VHC41_01180 [Mycobacteriales bacterium]|nr:hypothetical protein [Mycobacteriales bacterium]